MKIIHYISNYQSPFYANFVNGDSNAYFIQIAQMKLDHFIMSVIDILCLFVCLCFDLIENMMDLDCLEKSYNDNGVICSTTSVIGSFILN